MENTNVKTLGTLKDGERFSFGGYEWIALDHGNALTDNVTEVDARLCLMAELIDDSPFDKGDSNDWRTSSAREYLNGEFLEELARERMGESLTLVDDGVELCEYISDLTADDGLTDYGTSKDFVFLLSADDYRRNRYAIPNANDWWWLITPYSTPTSGISNGVRLVSTAVR